MSQIKIISEALVLVCDGRRARLLSNAGDAIRPQLVLVEEMESPHNPRAADQGASKPGRLDTPHGPRSSVEIADPHERMEEEFVRAVAARLAAIAEARGARSIIISAAPRALATLREELPAALKPLIVAELAKDYTKTPAHELARLILAN